MSHTPSSKFDITKLGYFGAYNYHLLHIHIQLVDKSYSSKNYNSKIQGQYKNINITKTQLKYLELIKYTCSQDTLDLMNFEK